MNNISQPNVEAKPKPLHLYVFPLWFCYGSHWLKKVLHTANHIFNSGNKFLNDKSQALRIEKRMLLEKNLLLL